MTFIAQLLQLIVPSNCRPIIVRIACGCLRCVEKRGSLRESPTFVHVSCTPLFTLAVLATLARRPTRSMLADVVYTQPLVAHGSLLHTMYVSSLIFNILNRILLFKSNQINLFANRAVDTAS